VNYALTGAKWGAPTKGTPSGPVTYSFVKHSYDNDPLDLTTQPFSSAFRADIREAFAHWSKVAGITFKEVADSPTSQIRLGWEPIDGDFYTVGEAYWTYRDGQLLNTWIGFDNGETWRTGKDGPELRNGLEFEAIALHEIGHAIGLGHYDATLAIMNPIITAESLRASDIAGVRALYGKAAAPIAVASAKAGATGADSHRATVLPEDGSDLELLLARAVEAVQRPGFDDAVAGVLGLEDGVLDGLGERLVALAQEESLHLEDAADALRHDFPALETALAARWQDQDAWLA
jgi:hypothetical protein